MTEREKLEVCIRGRIRKQGMKEGERVNTGGCRAVTQRELGSLLNVNEMDMRGRLDALSGTLSY